MGSMDLLLCLCVKTLTKYTKSESKHQNALFLLLCKTI